MSGVCIKGTGSYLPDKIATNEDFAKFIDTSNEWIVSHTGVERRRVAAKEPTWYMGAEAAKKAIAAAGLTAEDIDIIICTTVTADYRYPSMSCMIQGEIGATNAFCYDMAAACAALAYAMDITWRYVSTGGARNVLIVCAETLTQMTDYTDRASCILFGDGAGACVVGPREDGAFAASLHSDGSGAKHIYGRYPRKDTPFYKAEEARELDPLFDAPNGVTVMNGHEVYRFATRAMPKAVLEACEKLSATTESIDLFIPHQANSRIIEAAAKQLKIPMEKVCVNIQDYGNTSSATIAVALDECVRGGRLKEGDRVCLVGFGSGLVSGAAIFDYYTK